MFNPEVAVFRPLALLQLAVLCLSDHFLPFVMAGLAEVGGSPAVPESHGTAEFAFV